MPVLELPAALLWGLTGAACCGLGGTLVPAALTRLPRPRDLQPGEAGPDYRRHAGAPGLRPAAAVLGAGVGFGVGYRFAGDPLLPVLCLIAVAGLLLSYVDVREHRLPDAVVLPVAAVELALLVVAAAAADDWSALLRAVVGGSGSAALLLAVAVARPGGMGLGDVKLAGLTGALLGWLSWSLPLLGMLAGLVLGGLLGGVLMLAGRADRRTPIPLGPALLAGALLVAMLRGP